MSLVILDDLFRVVRGAEESHGVIVFLIEVGDEGKPISREGVGIRIREKGREGSCACHLFG